MYFRTKLELMKKISFVFLSVMLSLVSCQESFDERCQREARAYTEKNCPQVIDDGCVLDSATYLVPSRTYCYHYTLTGRFDQPEVRQRIIEKNSALRAELLKALCNSIDLKAYKDEGINFSYIYRSASTRQQVLKYTFTAQDYKGR